MAGSRYQSDSDSSAAWTDYSDEENVDVQVTEHRHVQRNLLDKSTPSPEDKFIRRDTQGNFLFSPVKLAKKSKSEKKEERCCVQCVTS